MIARFRFALRVSITATLLALAGPWSHAEAQGTRYTTAALRLRAAPSSDAAVVASIPRGTSVRVGACEDSWCEVRYRGTDGYAAERYLSSFQPALSTGGGYYINSRGERVRSPTYSPGGPPAGASAQCRDGTYSFSRSRRGTCSHHGGVRRWL